MNSVAQKIIDTEIALEALGIYDLIDEAKKKTGGTQAVFSGGGGGNNSGGGASSFLDLTDTPSSYVGQAGRGVRVNAGENALEFYAITDIAASIGGAIIDGTAGSVLFVDPDGILAQDNANFFYDAVTKRLGIGTDNPNSAGGIYTLFNGETVVNVQGSLAGYLASGGTAAFLGLACTTAGPDIKISSFINFGGTLHIANINDVGAVAKLMATFDLSTGYVGINNTTPSARLDVMNGALDAIKSQGINTFSLSTTASGQGILSAQMTSNGTTHDHTTYASIITNVGAKTAGTNIGYQSRITPSGSETSGHIDIAFAAADLGATSATNAAYYVGTGWQHSILTQAGAVILNETGSDSDVRIEGVNDENLFTLDAGNDGIYIGSAVDFVYHSKLFVKDSYIDSGAVSSGGFTVSHTITPSDALTGGVGFGGTFIVTNDSLTSGENITGLWNQAIVGGTSIDVTVGLLNEVSLASSAGSLTNTLFAQRNRLYNNKVGGLVNTGIGLDIMSPVLTGAFGTIKGIHIFNQGGSNVTNVDAIEIEAQSGAVTSNNALRIHGGDVVFNEDATTSIFRVESIANENMLYVDAANNAVGIGTNSPNAGSLHVARDDDEAAINFSYNGALQQQWRWRTGTNVTFFSFENVNTTQFAWKLYADATTDMQTIRGAGVGINTSDPKSKLHVNGSFGYKIRSVEFADSPVTADDESIILCDATGGNITVNLPAASGVTDRVYNIKKTDASANTVTIDGDGSETIDGATTKIISIQNDSFQIACDGVAWFII